MQAEVQASQRHHQGYQGYFLFSIFKNIYKMSAWTYFKAAQVSEKVIFLCFRLELCKPSWH